MPQSPEVLDLIERIENAKKACIDYYRDDKKIEAGILNNTVVNLLKHLYRHKVDQQKQMLDEWEQEKQDNNIILDQAVYARWRHRVFDDGVRNREILRGVINRQRVRCNVM